MTLAAESLPVLCLMREPSSGQSVAVFKRDMAWPFEYAFLGQTPNDKALRMTPIPDDIATVVPDSIVSAHEVDLRAAPTDVASKIAVEILERRVSGRKVSDPLVIM